MARKKRPEVVTRRGREAGEVLSKEDDRRLGQEGSLVEFFRRSPLVGVEVDLERRPDRSRDLDL